MPAYAGNSIGEASSLYNNEQARRAAIAENGFAQLMGALNLRREQAVQQNQFALQMAAAARDRATQADLAQQQIGISRQNSLIQGKRWEQEMDLNQKYFDFQKHLSETQPSPQQLAKFKEDYPFAANKAEQGAYGSDDEVVADIPDADELERKGLLNRSLAVRYANKVAAAPPPTANPTPTRPSGVGGLVTAAANPLLYLYRMFTRPSPENVAQPNVDPTTGIAARRARLITATQNPSTPGAPWLPNNSLVAARYQGQGGDYDPTLPMRVAAPVAPTAGVPATNPLVNMYRGAGAGSSWGPQPTAPTLTRPAVTPAPTGAAEGSIVRQKSTGQLFVVQDGNLVPYDQSR